MSPVDTEFIQQGERVRGRVSQAIGGVNLGVRIRTAESTLIRGDSAPSSGPLNRTLVDNREVEIVRAVMPRRTCGLMLLLLPGR
jgi:hypothetical protein